jgi:hypothetical protein
MLVCWRFDSLGRNLKHLATLLEELQAFWMAFVSAIAVPWGSVRAAARLWRVAQFDCGAWIAARRLPQNHPPSSRSSRIFFTRCWRRPR